MFPRGANQVQFNFQQKLECKGFLIQQQSECSKGELCFRLRSQRRINEATQSCERVPKNTSGVNCSKPSSSSSPTKNIPTTIKMFHSKFSTNMRKLQIFGPGSLSTLVHKVVETFLRLLMKIINFRLRLREGGNFSN